MEPVQKWIEEWNNIYPEDAMFNGRKLRVKTDYCINKMQKFCKANPQYTKDVIFAATKKYIDEQALKDFQFTKQSCYFIGKQGEPSLLEQYCQKVLIGDVKSHDDFYEYDTIDLWI